MATKLVLAFTGDVMLGRGVNEAVRFEGPAWPWGNMVEPLKAADLRVINLECVIAGAGEPWSRTPKTFLFKADPVAMETLKLADIDFVALANNHSLDFEVEAMVEMLDRLDAAGIARAGAGRDLDEASRPARLEAKGVRIAAISITDNEPVWAAAPGHPGVEYLPISIEPRNLARAAALIKRARRGADLVILSAHWGPNMVEAPTAVFRRFARAVVDAGVDIFHGHSAHIFQGIEIYKRKVIMYDTGDFVDDYVVDPMLRNDLSFLFLVTVEEGRPKVVELVPTRIDKYQVNKATGADADAAMGKMIALSAEIGTKVERVDNTLRVEVPEPLRTRHFGRSA